ncbi:MAG: sugar phosphate nucleotidyltransferase [Ignavibacteria bacterium]|nr:sugar phosphate nucleotidyltransferase [Ignavibacteria bacterium]
MITHAMILAAGFGTRLKPLTDNLPKALVKHRGKPMIMNVIEKLSNEGIREFIINTHYHHEKIKSFLDKVHDFKITVIIEKEILGTGGAVKNARIYLQGSGDFLLYNTDVDSDINIREMNDYHTESGSLATIAVQKRITTRPLYFDRDLFLEGRKPLSKDSNEMAFSGIHIISDRIFSYMPEEDKFDIVDFYISLAGSKGKIRGYDIGDIYWKDLGRISDLTE